MKQNYDLNPYHQPQEETTEAQKILIFILVAPILGFGLLCIIAIFNSAIMAMFPNGEMALKFRTQKSKSVEVKKLEQPTKVQKNSDCLYVPESFVPLGVSFENYKKEVKKETGVKCLLFTEG